MLPLENGKEVLLCLFFQDEVHQIILVWNLYSYLGRTEQALDILGLLLVYLKSLLDAQ